MSMFIANLCPSTTFVVYRLVHLCQKLLNSVFLTDMVVILLSSDNQFGFKKKSSCTHAVYTLRSVVDYYVNNGSAVNICAHDISKAFDKMNHHGLFLKLMQKQTPWNYSAYLKIGLSYAQRVLSGVQLWFFSVDCGVRQGGVLSPYLFALYIDSIVDLQS